MSHLPRFNDHAHPGTHKDHPASVLIVVNQIKEDYQLNENICNDLLQNLVWRSSNS